MARHSARSRYHGGSRAAGGRAPAIAIGIAAAALVAGVVGAQVLGVDVIGMLRPEGGSLVGGPGPRMSPSPSETRPAEPGPVSFTLVASGDMLPHGAVVNDAKRSGSYDWDALWGEIDPYVAGADLAICHMEVPVAPPGTSPSGFPVFAAPPEMVPAIKAQGWDGCSTGSNHSVDKGWDGVVATLDAFTSIQMGAVGTARSEEEAAEPQVYKVRTGSRVITVAHISWSYGTNGLPKPAGKPWSVNTYNANAVDVSGILAQAQAARDAGADVVIASLHCCVEYQTQPTAAQRQAAQKIADSGLVDLYIGHHAHVPQPIELLAGGPNGDGMWTAFGLGNFISNQDYSTVGVRESVNGLLLTATFTVDLDGTVHVDAEWTGLTVDRTGGHVLYLLAEHQGGVGNLSASEVADRYRRVRDAVGDDAPERLEPPGALADAAYWIRRGPWTPDD